jgi:hypothetical protein
MGKDTSGRQVLKAFQSSGKNTESLLNDTRHNYFQGIRRVKEALC